MNRGVLVPALVLASALLGAFLVVLPRSLARARTPVGAGAAAGPVSPSVEPSWLAETAAHGQPVLEARTPAEARAVVRYASTARKCAILDLRHMARAEDPLVAGNAVRALGRLGADPAGGTIEDLLRDPRPRVRQEAVVALGLSGDEEAVTALEGILERGEQDLGPLAVQALGRIGGQRARSILERRLEDPATSEVERAFARQALEEWPQRRAHAGTISKDGI